MENYINPEELRRLIKRHRLLQSEMAFALEITQGQISRLIAGRFKAPGKAYENLCVYVTKAIRRVEPVVIIENAEIMEAITSVWDGSSEQASSLAQVIRSLGPLCKKAI